MPSSNRIGRTFSRKRVYACAAYIASVQFGSNASPLRSEIIYAMPLINLVSSAVIVLLIWVVSELWVDADPCHEYSGV